MASLAAAAPKPIKALFAEAEALLRKVEDGADADDASTCVSLLDDAWAAAAALDLFPAGCTGDDVATAAAHAILLQKASPRHASPMACCTTRDARGGAREGVERCWLL